MNKKVICYLLGKISIGSAIALLLPLIASFYYQEGHYTDYFIAALVPAYCAFMFRQFAWNVETKDITMREWIFAIVFGWLMVAGFAALPYVLIDILNPIDAYFEGMSGLTTTGVTSIKDISALPKCLIFWRSLTGWFGGIVSIVVFVAILPQFAGSSTYLFNSESSGNAKVGVLPRMKDSAYTLLLIYFVLTVFFTALETSPYI